LSQIFRLFERQNDPTPVIVSTIRLFFQASSGLGGKKSAQRLQGSQEKDGKNIAVSVLDAVDEFEKEMPPADGLPLRSRFRALTAALGHAKSARDAMQVALDVFKRERWAVRMLRAALDQWVHAKELTMALVGIAAQSEAAFAHYPSVPGLRTEVGEGIGKLGSRQVRHRLVNAKVSVAAAGSGGEAAEVRYWRTRLRMRRDERSHTDSSAGSQRPS
jgi:hypothetical protein